MLNSKVYFLLSTSPFPSQASTRQRMALLLTPPCKPQTLESSCISLFPFKEHQYCLSLVLKIDSKIIPTFFPVSYLYKTLVFTTINTNMVNF